MDGTVTQKVTNAGEYVAAGASVYLISGNRRADWVVGVGVSDKDWARLQPGNRASVRLDAYPDRTFSGTVGKLAQAADPVNKLYEGEVKINSGPDGPGTAKFAPGLFANVTLVPAQSRPYAVVADCPDRHRSEELDSAGRFHESVARTGNAFGRCH